MTIIEKAIRRPVTLTVIVSIIVMFGFIGLFSVPVQLTPNVDQPVVTVTTRWFGASPQEVVREITEEQEEVLKTVDGLKEMTSVSSEGQAEIRLEFSVGIDKGEALNEVRDKLRQVPDYPADVDEPTVDSVDARNRDYIAWIMLTPTGEIGENGPPAPGFDGDVTKLGDFAEDFIKPVLERAEGVAEINVWGGREREAQVRVNLDKLAARGITIEQFTNRLRQANADVTAGSLPEGKRDTSIRVVGQYDDPEQIANTVVAESADGTPVYVRDVAEVEIDFKKETGFVRALGKPVLAINAQRETGSNVLVVMENLKAAIDEVNESVLGPTNWGLQLKQVYDQTEYIDDAVSTASWNLLFGALLAGSVLFFTLRNLGATLVVMVAIPVSVIGTFLGMWVLGRNLNVISMAGLTFAVGMGIDNAIVVLENIFRHREMGKGRIKAAVEGTLEVWEAILASTLTNIAVFLPIIFIEEEAGQLFRDMSVALTISFFLYLFVAPTVIPMLTTLFLRKVPASMHADSQADAARRKGLLATVGRYQRRAGEGFYNAIYWLTGGLPRRLALVLTFVIGSSLLTWAIWPDDDYLPQGNQNMVFGVLAAPPGYSVEEFRGMAAGVEAQLAPWWEAEPGSKELAELQKGWRQQVDQFILPGMREQLAQTEAALKQNGAPPEEIEKETAQLKAMIRQYEISPPPSNIENFFFVKFGSMGFMGARSGDAENIKPLELLMNGTVQGVPGTFGFFQQASIFQNADTNAGLVLTLSGPSNEQVLQSAGYMFGQLMQTFDTYPQTEPQNFNIGRPEVQYRPDRVKAGAAGVSEQAIRQVGQVAVDGLILGDYRDGNGRAIDLTIISDEGREGRFGEDLREVPLATVDGRVVPYGSVTTEQRLAVPQNIYRVEEQPAVKFTISLPPGMPISQASEIAESVVADAREAGVLPPTIRVDLGGSADKLTEFRRAFLPGLLLAAVITYLLMAALFENWVYPFVIILSVPFALAGGFVGLELLNWGLAISDQPPQLLNVLTLLGFVILIGTIVNNPILIVYQSLNNMREGMERRQAIAFSTHTRVRPIFMSVITTVAGLSPLVLAGGAGSELYRGLGAVIVGGLITSTVFTLLLTPTLLSLMLDAVDFFKRLFNISDDPESGHVGRTIPVAKPIEAHRPAAVPAMARDDEPDPHHAHAGVPAVEVARAPEAQ